MSPRIVEEGALDGWITALLEALARLGDWRYLVAFVGTFAETSLFVGLVIPGDTLVLLTATVNRGVVQWLLLVLTVIAGALGGESVGFLIGRYFGPKLRSSRLGRRLGTQWDRSEVWIERRGGPGIFLSRFLPVLHALVPVTVGAVRFPYLRFIRWTVPACVTWAVIYVSIGQIAGASYQALADDLRFAGWIVLGGVVAVVALFALGKKLLDRRLNRDGE